MINYKFSLIVILLLFSPSVFAWSCDKGCPTAVFSGKYECLTWKAANCNGNNKTGAGCGSGWNTDAVPDSFGGANFFDACKNHDTCYEACGSLQNTCDVSLRDEMKDECKDTFHKSHEVLVKNSCLKSVDGYYASVKNAGGSSFKEAQAQCSVLWKYAIDANGGKDSPYSNSNLSTNDNLLFSLVKHGDYYMIKPKVKNVSLDANGGKDSPYFNSNLGANDNLLFSLVKYGDYYMIKPKVKNVSLDANGGKGKPYFNKNPDQKNSNHLWSLQKSGNYYRIYSKVK